MPKNLNYPLASFQKAYELAIAVDALGGRCTVENCAQKLQRKISGGFMVIISSAQKFSLVSFEKGIITVSEEYKLIKSSSNGEKISLLRKAFLNPQVFNALYQKFKDRDLSIDTLNKSLVQEFKVEESTVTRVAGYFIEGLKAYGLITEDDIVKDDQKMTSNQNSIKTEKEKPVAKVEPPPIKKTKPEKVNASFTKEKLSAYEVQITGTGINSRISIENEDDLLILEAILNKIRNSF